MGLGGCISSLCQTQKRPELVYCACCRKWKLISHPDTTNPFVASFVNYRCTCQLYPITVGSQTFFDWKGEPPLSYLSHSFDLISLESLTLTQHCCAGEFYTDPQHVTGMQVRQLPFSVQVNWCHAWSLSSYEHKIPLAIWVSENALREAHDRISSVTFWEHMLHEGWLQMQATWERWYITAFQALQVLLSCQPAARS